MAELTPFERDIRQLTADLRRLETAYTQYFAGQLRRPPIDLRNRVDALIRQHDRAYIQGYADRYRFATLQARYHKFVELWDRSTRAREEGRGVGPAAARAGCAEPPTPTPPRTEPSGPAAAPVDFSTTIGDPAREIDRLRQLHARLVEASEQVGQPAPTFSGFSHLVRVQVHKLQRAGADSVAFQVGVKDGKVAFSARGVKEKPTAS